MVFENAASGLISCVAVSPSGAARVWTNLEREHNFRDFNINICKNESFTSLKTLHLPEANIIVANSSGRLVHVNVPCVRVCSSKDCWSWHNVIYD